MSGRRSKFQDILDQREAAPPVAEEAAPPALPASDPAPAAKPQRKPEPPRAAAPPPQANGKALAKSKDPAYTPVTVYVRKDTYQNIQMRLLAQGRRREVSDLTNELFEAWLAGQG